MTQYLQLFPNGFLEARLASILAFAFPENIFYMNKKASYLLQRLSTIQTRPAGNAGHWVGSQRAVKNGEEIMTDYKQKERSLSAPPRFLLQARLLLIGIVVGAQFEYYLNLKLA